MYDVLIKNGRVIDGTGAPGFEADVAIASRRIVAIGRLDGEARRVIDAGGLVVAPGFIDLHSHADFNFFVDPTADSKITQGVTLEYVGNCGISFCAPLLGEAAVDLETRVSWYETDWRPDWTGFADYLDRLEAAGSTLNIATQVGHGTVRRAVLGSSTRAPEIGELKQMQTLVAEALDAGALGFSTGLSMAPGSYSLVEEVIALGQVAGDRGKLYSSHIRDSGGEGSGEFVAMHEAIEVARRTGAASQISHLKCNGSMRGRAAEMLDLIEAARNEGLDVAADQYPYTAASGPMSGNVFPKWALEGGREKALERVSDSDLRPSIRAGLERGIEWIGGPDRLMIASYPVERRYEGMGLDALAGELACPPAEALLRLFESFDAQLILSGMAQDDVDLIAAAPTVAVASDGSSIKATGPLSAGKPHPRSYGTFPRFLAQMVREKGLVSLEEAIRKMTLLPAARLGLESRGRLAAGYFADVAVLDPETVQDHATFTDPHRYSSGVEHVLVNGEQVVADGAATGRTPGRVLRRASD